MRWSPRLTHMSGHHKQNQEGQCHLRSAGCADTEYLIRPRVNPRTVFVPHTNWGPVHVDMNRESEVIP